MPNTSATGGYLLPSGAQPLEGDTLDDFVHDWVVGITGLTNDLVRPRWQIDPPNIPLDGITWAALGLTDRDQDSFAYELDSATSSKSARHEVLTFLISFYGVNADSLASIFSQGAQIAQNREPLMAQAMAFVASENLVTTNEMVKERWLRRIDVQFKMRRQLVRTYAISSILTAPLGAITVANQGVTINII